MVALFPEILSACRAYQFEKAAILMRRYFGGPTFKAPKLDIDQLIRQFGASMLEREEEQLGSIAIKNSLEGIDVVILYNPRLPEHDLRFLKASLLGRFLFQFQKDILEGHFEKVGAREFENPANRYMQDSYSSANSDALYNQHADYFAGALLLPSAMFRRAVDSKLNSVVLCSLFAVAEEVVLARKNQLYAQVSPERSRQDSGFLQIEKRLEKPLKQSSVAEDPLDPRLTPQPKKDQNSVKKQGVQAYHQSSQEEPMPEVKKERVEAFVSKRKKQAKKRPARSLSRIREIAKMIDASVEVEEK